MLLHKCIIISSLTVEDVDPLEVVVLSEWLPDAEEALEANHGKGHQLHRVAQSVDEGVTETGVRRVRLKTRKRDHLRVA